MSAALAPSCARTTVMVTGWKLGASLRPQLLLSTDPGSKEEVNPGGSTPKAAPDECGTWYQSLPVHTFWFVNDTGVRD